MTRPLFVLSILLGTTVSCATAANGPSDQAPRVLDPPQATQAKQAKQEPLTAADLDRDLNELVESAFVRQALREAPEIVGNGVVRIGSDLPLHPLRRGRIRGALDREFNEERLLRGVKAHVRARVSTRNIHRMARQLREHPVRRINQLGFMANRAPPEALFRYLRRLKQTPPSEARVRAIRRLQQNYSGVRLTVAMVAAPLVSVSEILAASMPTEEEAAMVRALHRAAIREIGLEQMTPDIVEAALIFGFRDVPDHELVAFADFFDSDLGRLYHRSMVTAFFTALTERTEATTRDIRLGTESSDEGVLTL